MRSSRCPLVLAPVALIAVSAVLLQAQTATCLATIRTMTPVSFTAPSELDASASRELPSSHTSPLVLVADVPLPGPAKRFDYQSFDSTTSRLYISHMHGDRLDVFDIKTGKLVASREGFPGATGVLAVPALHKVYVSVTDRHQVAVVDDRTLRTIAWVSGADFPDGIAYAPDEHLIFVSDEHGGVDLVIDGSTNERVARVPLGGEAGNTHYDPVSHCMLVAVQTRNELAAIDPRTRRIVARYPMPCEHPHGFLIEERSRLAFVTCEGDAKLLVLDLRTMRVTAMLAVPDDPDVLAFDRGLRRLYVACESGAVAVFDLRDAKLTPLGVYRAPYAHSVAVDPATHRVYLPLQDVGGRPVLRILQPAPR
ncbi:MAG TPA: YncE family protein [Gemmatimonadaceae bacterium]|nr:YncE family protein [Gemmatimonadaceae bacterium]